MNRGLRSISRMWSFILTCPSSHLVVDCQLLLVLDPHMSEFSLQSCTTPYPKDIFRAWHFADNPESE